MSAGCGPNAAPITLGAPSTPIVRPDVTPVAWRLEPTPTPAPPGRATATAMAAPRPQPTPALPAAPPPAPTAAPAAPPVGGAVSPPAGDPRATISPTPDVPHPYPTPTPEAPVQCQFGGRALSVLPQDAAPSGLTPGVVPTFFRGVPGLTTYASGEPLPGVLLELRLARTTFVAGALIQPEIRVRNTSGSDISLSEFVSVLVDGQDQPGQPVQSDRRSFPSLIHTGPAGMGGTTIPDGQTWSIPSAAQLPFDAAEPAHLHAAASVQRLSQTSYGAAQGPRVIADVPLRLTAATPAEQLHLELRADQRQWCLQARDASGGPPTGPVSVRLNAHFGAGGYAEGPVGGGTGDTWAQRWQSYQMPQNAPVSLTVWVGGPNYVTAQAQTTVSLTP